MGLLHNFLVRVGLRKKYDPLEHASWFGPDGEITDIEVQGKTKSVGAVVEQEDMKWKKKKER